MKDNVPSKACRRNGCHSDYAKEKITIPSNAVSHEPKADGGFASPSIHTHNMSEITTFSSDSGCMLHTAIELGTPDNEMMMLAKRFPFVFTQVDEHGRYPVHVACAHGASSRFAALCVWSNPSSATAKDKNNNTPLQLLCKGTWNGVWDLKTNPSAEKNMIDILEILYRKAPVSLLSEDSGGLGPIEHAINSNLDLKFIVSLNEKIAHLNRTKDQKYAHRKCIATRRESASMKFPHAAHEA